MNLHDDRFLPFEGAGAISTWRIELPNDIPQFDFETISDVVMHLRYTAREAGQLSQAAAQHVLEDVLQDPQNLLQLFSLNADFGAAWQAFTSAASDANRHLNLAVNIDQFPYWLKRVGMDDVLTATFSTIDFGKHKLAVAPATVSLDGGSQAGWTLDIAQGSPVFAFLKNHMAEAVYMSVSYAASS